MGMQSSSVLSGQLSLDFSEGILASEISGRPPVRQIKNILFPKNMVIPHFGHFQRQVTGLFAPLGIDVDFRMTRQRRLEMRMIFPIGQVGVLRAAAGQDALFRAASAFTLSDEESDAFRDVIIDFASNDY